MGTLSSTLPPEVALSQAAVGNLAPGLLSLAGGLEATKACVAQEFTALAATLNLVAQRARDIAAVSKQVVGLAAEAESDQAIDTLKRILNDVQRVQTLETTSQEKLPEVLAGIQRSRSPLLRLAKMRSLLHAVGTLSRIEESRLTSVAAGFALGAEIDGLAEQIERQVAAMTEESQSLEQLIVAASQRLSQTKGQDQQHATDLIQRTQGVLQQVHARVETSRGTARRIDEQYAGVRTAIDKIVMSLQTEDIARQRVEHVQEALRQAAEALASGGSLAEHANVVILQRSQLLRTRELLSSSIGSVLESLRSLGSRTDDLTGATAALASQRDRDGRSFAAAIEDSLKAVSSIFGAYSVSTHTVDSIVATVVPSLATMTRGAAELDEIESSIRLIALNAAIKTAHLGDEGVAMSVLATELQKITVQSEEHTHLVLDALNAMEQALAAISSQRASADGSILLSSSADEIAAEVSRLAVSVTRAGDQMSRKLANLSESTAELRTELDRICETAGSAAITQLFDTVVDKLENSLVSMGYCAGTTPVSEGKAAGMSALYSMQAERDVHQETFGGPAIGGTEPAEDDIELF